MPSNSTDAKTQMKSWNSKRLWMILCCVLALITLGLLIGIIVLAIAKRQPDLCNTPHCVKTAGTLLEHLDTTVDPCDNFFDFACGGWLKKTVIPEDKASYGTFTEVGEEVQVVLKELFEREKSSDDIEVITKVKDFYSSCVDLEKMDERDATPLIGLLHYLGGWPVLGNSAGGFWNETDYDFVALLGRLSGEYNNDIIISSWAGIDDKNSSRYVLHVDQPSLGLAREHFLEEEYAEMKQAYFDYMVKITTMLGANEATAINDMKAVLEYETILANATVPKQERRDTEALYNPTTVGGLDEAIPQINWTRYFDIIMPDETKPIPNNEDVINYSPDYLTKAATVTFETPSRVITNYLIWRITMNRVPNLSQRFKDAKQEYTNKLVGTKTVTARWRHCVDYINSAFMFATGRMYVEENFAGDSKPNMENLIGHVKSAFKDMLKYNDWMDEETKVVAKEKCDSILEHIGYPDWIKEDNMLTDYYKKFGIAEGKWFENVLAYIGWAAHDNLSRLRKPVDKEKWLSGPAVVNAFYSASRNRMVFPAGILRPPLYHKDSPWYLNYGAIGVLIGHELTHAFDDKGRQFDKDGNLKQWWSDESIEKFKERAQCIVDQYSEYVMPENNKTLNGKQTQGENIADNGGLKEAFKAYKESGYPNARLPGLDEYTPEQLFYISNAQTWCGVYRPQGLDLSLLRSVHSPGRYRVNGPFQNSYDFADVFSCPHNSNMNPEKKCVVW